jgi:hypothetical protein
MILWQSIHLSYFAAAVISAPFTTVQLRVQEKYNVVKSNGTPNQERKFQDAGHLSIFNIVIP